MKVILLSLGAIAQLLKIPKHLIVRVECWEYVIFVHRSDRGGQFISYRTLRNWLNAVACQIQKGSTCQQLRSALLVRFAQSLWLAFEEDYTKHEKQYSDDSYPFLCKIWTKRWDKLWGEQKLADSAVGF